MVKPTNANLQPVKILTPHVLMNSMPVQFHDFKFMDALSSNSEQFKAKPVPGKESSSVPKNGGLCSLEKGQMTLLNGEPIPVQPRRNSNVVRMNYATSPFSSVKPISPPPTACESPETVTVSVRDAMETQPVADFEKNCLTNSVTPLYS
jgi:hypothetical protein